MTIQNKPIFQIIINVHNLMINPDDVPNNDKWVLNEKGKMVYCRNGKWYGYSDYYDINDNVCATPKLWYDIPKFDTDRTELEKLSKEELIELIIKERGKK